MKTKTKIAIPALMAVIALTMVAATPYVSAQFSEAVRDFDGPSHSEVEDTDNDMESIRDSDGEGHSEEGLDNDISHAGDSDGENRAEDLDSDGEGHSEEGLDNDWNNNEYDRD